MNHTINAKELQKLNAEELACLAREGSEAYFTELVNRYGPRLYHFFRRKVNCVQDAEDLVQETLVKAYKNIHRYQPRYKFSTWIFTIGTRQAASYYRSISKRRLAEYSFTVSAEPDPCEITARQEENRNLWVLARKLPEKQYDVLWLRYAEDMPIKEIARVLRLTRINIKVLLYRARVRLAKLHQNVAVPGKPVSTGREMQADVRKIAMAPNK